MALAFRRTQWQEYETHLWEDIAVDRAERAKIFMPFSALKSSIVKTAFASLERIKGELFSHYSGLTTAAMFMGN